MLFVIHHLFSYFKCTDDSKLHRKNTTTNRYLQELPEPPIIELIKEEDDWLPWKNPLNPVLRHLLQEEEEEKRCREDSSMDDFPDDLFSRNSFNE